MCSLSSLLVLIQYAITVCTAEIWSRATSELGAPGPRDGCVPSTCLHMSSIGELLHPGVDETTPRYAYLLVHSPSATWKIAARLLARPSHQSLEAATLSELSRVLSNHCCEHVDTSTFLRHSAALGADKNADGIASLYGHALWDILVSKPSPWFTDRTRAILGAASIAWKLAAARYCSRYFPPLRTPLACGDSGNGLSVVAASGRISAQRPQRSILRSGTLSAGTEPSKISAPASTLSA